MQYIQKISIFSLWKWVAQHLLHAQLVLCLNWNIIYYISTTWWVDLSRNCHLLKKMVSALRQYHVIWRIFIFLALSGSLPGKIRDSQTIVSSLTEVMGSYPVRLKENMEYRSGCTLLRCTPVISDSCYGDGTLDSTHSIWEVYTGFLPNFLQPPTAETNCFRCVGARKILSFWFIEYKFHAQPWL